MNLAFLLAGVFITAIAAKTQLNWQKTYNNYPQPILVKDYVQGSTIFTCKGPFALCSYAECVVVPGSKPLVAECGCISFNGQTLSGTTGFLRKEGVNETISYCKKKGLETKNPSYCANNTNTAPLCKRVNSGTVYSNKYDYVSLYNPVDWQEATGEGGSEKICTAGGTVAICYTAACINAPPTSPYLTQKTNATCYCPVYNVKKGVPFAVTNNATTACGPKTLAGLKPSTIIYNGA